MAANGTEAVRVSNLKAVVDNLSTRVDAGGGVVLFSGEITSATIPLSADPTTFDLVEVIVNESQIYLRYFPIVSPKINTSYSAVGYSGIKCSFSATSATISGTMLSNSPTVIRGYRF